VQRSWGQTEVVLGRARPVARCLCISGIPMPKDRTRSSECFARTTGLEIREGPPRLKSGNCAPRHLQCGRPCQPIHRSGFRSAPSPERPCVRLPPRLHAECGFAWLWGAAARFCSPELRCLLDSSSPGFEPELARVVLEAVEQWDHQLLETQQHPGGPARAGHPLGEVLYCLTSSA